MLENRFPSLSKKGRSCLPAVLLLSVVAVASATVSPASVDLSQTAFGEVPAAQLFEASAALDPELREGQDIVVLYRRQVFRFDDQGRLTTTVRSIFEVVSEAGVEEAGRLAAYWSPWHQDPPILEARVVDREGGDARLDPATISEVSPSAAQDVYTDRKALEAPLPALAAGVIVDQRVVIENREAFFRAGDTVTAVIDDWYPVVLSEVELDHPSSLPVRWLVEDAGGTALVEETAALGRRLVRLSAAGLEARKLAPYYQGLEHRELPSFAFSTGESWASVAQAYSERVDEVIRDGSGSIVGSPELSEDPVEAIARALQWVHSRVRYTGLELGESGIIPHRIPDILERGYGDCKDQATLMTALLRGAGFDAHLALLRASHDQDISADLPGLGGFNHAIVHVAEGSGLWVDPTSRYSDRGSLPVIDQGRLALIASPSSTGLVTTPISDFSKNHVVETREVRFGLYGEGSVRETTTYRGDLASSHRYSWIDTSENDAEERLAAYIESSYDASELREIRIGDPAKLDSPFELEFEVPRSGRFVSDLDVAVAVLDPTVVLTYLPESLLQDPSQFDADPQQLEGSLLRIALPLRSELVYRIQPPPGMALRDLPDDVDVGFPGGGFSADYEIAADGTIEARFGVELRDRELGYEDFVVARDAVFDLVSRDLPLLWFDHRAIDLLESGEPIAALDLYEEIASEHPKSPVPYIQKVYAWLATGLKEMAAEEAHKALEIAPDSALSHWAVATVHEHGETGIRLAPGFDREAAIAAYEKAIELDPEEEALRVNLALLYEHGDDGLQYGSGANLDKAVELLNEIVLDSEEADIYRINLLIDLLRLGRYDEILKRQDLGSAGRDAYSLVVAAAAAKDGAESGVRKARQLGLTGDDRTHVLDAAASQLTLTAKFREASDLLRRSASGSASSSALLTRARVNETAAKIVERELEGPSPESAVLELNVAVHKPRFDRDEFLQMLHPLSRSIVGPGFWRATEVTRAATKKVYASIGQDFGAMGEVPGILVAATTELRKEGNEKLGWKVEAHSMIDNESATYLLAEHEGRAMVVAGPGLAGPAGAVAYEELSSGDIEGAVQWLEWGASLSGQGHFQQLWGQYSETRDVDLLSTLIFSYLAQHQGGAFAVERSIPATSELFERAEDRQAFEWLRIAAFMSANRAEDALDSLDRLQGGSLPESERNRLLLTRVQLLTQLDRWDDAEGLLTEALSETPDDVLLLTRMSDLSLSRGDASDYLQWAEKVLEVDPNNSAILNNSAWALLFLDEESEGRYSQALRLAERANSASGSRSRSSLHTMATVYAFNDDPMMAFATLSESIQLDPSLSANYYDWLVYGRIAESCGKKELARDYYQRVLDAGDTQESGLKTNELARRSLASLAP